MPELVWIGLLPFAIIFLDYLFLSGLVADWIGHKVMDEVEALVERIKGDEEWEFILHPPSSFS